MGCQSYRFEPLSGQVLFITHQLIGIASFYKYGNSVNTGHSETKDVGPNLNAPSSDNPIPQGPSSSLQPFETILPQQKEFLDSVFGGG